MYSYFSGKVTEKNIDNIVIECGGIGYLISLPARDLESILINKDYRIFTHLAVRDNDMELFGFVKKEDLEIFRKLISISKIGPRTALNILSLYSTAEITEIVAKGDVDRLSKVSGIGKKGAGRIILELKGKIDFSLFDEDSRENDPEIIVYVKDALRNFGYRAEPINKVCKKVGEKYTDLSQLEDAVKFALKNIEGGR